MLFHCSFVDNGVVIPQHWKYASPKERWRQQFGGVRCRAERVDGSRRAIQFRKLARRKRLDGL